MSGESRDERKRRFLEKAGELYDRMVSGGRAGSGESFDEIESEASDMGREFSVELLRARLEVEERSEGGEIECPRCGSSMRRLAKAGERNLESICGVVNYSRRHAICDKCGGSFSPSGQKA
jgi:DNA-directed RNA polymerase subunit RPC12/RpoP